MKYAATISVKIDVRTAPIPAEYQRNLNKTLTHVAIHRATGLHGNHEIAYKRSTLVCATSTQTYIAVASQMRCTDREIGNRG